MMGVNPDNLVKKMSYKTFIVFLFIIRLRKILENVPKHLEEVSNISRKYLNGKFTNFLCNSIHVLLWCEIQNFLYAQTLNLT